MKPIRYHSEAAEEFRQAVDYSENCRDGLGLRFNNVVEAAEHHIAHHPTASMPYKLGFRKRMVHKPFSYVIFYKEFDDHIWIAAVAHTSRREDYWINHEPE